MKPQTRQIPSEIREAFEQRVAAPKSEGPLVYRWVFDPETGHVHVAHNQGHALDVEHHRELGEKVTHPHKQHGYAHRIVNGWRITDWDSKAVTDQFVIKQVLRALDREDGNDSDDTEESRPFTGKVHYGRALD